MALYGYLYEINKPFHLIKMPRTAVQQFDDTWIASFPDHATEYRLQLDLLSTNLNMDEDEKRHSVATRIRAHAIHPENWDMCPICHVRERMDNGF